MEMAPYRTAFGQDPSALPNQMREARRAVGLDPQGGLDPEFQARLTQQLNSTKPEDQENIQKLLEMMFSMVDNDEMPSSLSTALQSIVLHSNPYRNLGYSDRVTPGNVSTARALIGAHVGATHQCAALTQALAPGVGRASTWRRGENAQAGGLAIGTAIATFNFGENGYGPAGHEGGWYGVSHTGIYMGSYERRTENGQVQRGMLIYDQWVGSPGAQIRFIPWEGTNNSNTGARYFAIRDSGGSTHVAGNLPTIPPHFMATLAPIQPQTMALTAPTRLSAPSMIAAGA
jgi:hypothetical protein